MDPLYFVGKACYSDVRGKAAEIRILYGLEGTGELTDAERRILNSCVHCGRTDCRCRVQAKAEAVIEKYTKKN